MNTIALIPGMINLDNGNLSLLPFETEMLNFKNEKRNKGINKLYVNPVIKYKLETEDYNATGCFYRKKLKDWGKPANKKK